MLRRSRSLLSTLVLTGAALAQVHAAELGDARVSSHIGQQLVADIELAMIDDPAAQVAVRVASPEVYRGAGIALPPVLPSLNLTVMRRDGRQFLHVTSLRPVDADHLHLYLELTDKGQRAVRLATLWLTPDPNPAPPAPLASPVPSPVPVTLPASAAPVPVLASASAPGARAPAVAAASAPAPAPAPAPASASASANAAAHGTAPLASPVSASRPAPARPLAAHPAAAPAVRPAAQPPADAPAAAAPPAVLPATAMAKPAVQLLAERKKPLLNLPIHKPTAPAALRTGSQPAACTPGEAQACTALGAKNAALREQLSQLEDKVKGLQKMLGVTPAAAAAPVAEAHKAGTPRADAPKAEAAKPAEPAEHKADAAKADANKAEAHKAEANKAAEHQADEGKAGEHKAEAHPSKEHKPEDAKSGEQRPEAAPAQAAPAAAKPPEPKQAEPKPAPPAGPKPISSIKTLVPHKPKTAPVEEGGAPWGWIAAGAALLAAGAGAAFLLKRRAKAGRSAGTPAEAGTTGLLGKLKARFAGRAGASAAAVGTPQKVVEPTME